MKSLLLLLLCLSSFLLVGASWQQVISLHEEGKTEAAFSKFLELKKQDRMILARDDKGLLDAAQKLFEKQLAATNDEAVRLRLARLQHLRGQLAKSRVHFEVLAKNSKEQAVRKEANERIAEIDKELNWLANYKSTKVRPKRSKLRQKEIEDLERKVDQLLEQNNELRRAINNAHRNSVSARFEARKMERLIAERKEEYRQYREDYQLFYRNLR